MAKRHKHFEGSRSRGRSSTRGRGKSGGRGRGGFGFGGNNSTGKHNDNWSNSSVPLGGGDFSEPGMVHIDYNPGRRKYVSQDTIEDYYFGKNSNRKSMKMGGFRPGHHRDDDESNVRQISFRKNPMKFIKSKEPYDPSHDLIEQLRKKALQPILEDSKVEDDVDTEMTELDNNKEILRMENTSEIKEEETYDGNTNQTKPNDIEYNDEFDSYSSESFEEISDKDLFFVDQDGYDMDTLPTIKTAEIDEVNLNVKVPRTNINNTEFNPIFTVGKIELNVQVGLEGDSVVLNDSRRKYHPFSNYISNIMRNIEVGSENDEEEDEDFDYELATYQPLDEPEEIQKEIDSNKKLSNDIQSLSISNNESNAESSEPEFGFLEEDFVVNTSEISVTNMRLGSTSNSYFLKAYQFFGDYEYRWIEQELFVDFILEELGLPDHRLCAYLSFIKDAIIPKEEPPSPTYSDVAFSDTSESESDDESILGDDMREGLDDLVSYALKYDIDRNQEFDTKSLKTVGKGKKKKFLVSEDMQLDSEIMSLLQDKLGTRLETKAKRIRTEKDFIDKENQTSDDLYKKYPYGLHVLNIKSEFDDFLNRLDKDTLVFPPLDAHGNKTISKFAGHYFMKTNKRGRGKLMHILVQKTKKTTNCHPNYVIIDNLTKQRPLFLRADVIKPKDDFQRTERLKLPKGKFHAKEGDIVGQDAPVIGDDNIGRRMLEKLGWTQGEGLGVHGNKGISEPVFATVKNSKIGLRHRQQSSEE